MCKIKKQTNKQTKQMTAGAGENVKKVEHSSIVGESRNLCNHQKNMCGGSSGRWESMYLSI